MEYGIDVVGAIFATGIVFWLAGGAKWLGEKTRRMKLDNDRIETERRQSGHSGRELPE